MTQREIYARISKIEEIISTLEEEMSRLIPSLDGPRISNYSRAIAKRMTEVKTLERILYLSETLSD